MANVNVEVVFSGAGRIKVKSQKMDPQLLGDFAFLHFNCKYDWLRPTLQEIVAAYMKLYGKESHESHDKSSGAEGPEGTEEENGKENGEGRRGLVPCVRACVVYYIKQRITFLIRSDLP